MHHMLRLPGFAALPMILAAQSLLPVAGSGPRPDSTSTILLDSPFGLAEDAQGNVYVSERYSGIIRRISPAGTIERFAGTGILTDGLEGQPARETSLAQPTVLAAAADGTLVFADPVACRIRQIAPNGRLTNLIGTGRCAAAAGAGGGGFPFPGGGGGGTATADRRALETDLASVGGLAFASDGRLYYSDESNHLVRRLDKDGVVRTVAGSGAAGFAGDGGTATSAFLNSPRGLAFDSAGRLYIADGANCRVRRIIENGNLETAAGSGCAGSNSAATVPGRLTALAYDADQNALYIASPGTARILRFNIDSSQISVALGNGRRTSPEPTTALNTSIDEPSALLASRGRLLVADPTGYRILSLTANMVSIMAGGWPQPNAYPPALATQLLRPRGLCVLPAGTLIAIDAGAERLISIRTSGQALPLAGARTFAGFSGGDGGPALAAQIAQPKRVVCAPDGTVYLTQGNQIRAIDPAGNIRTVLSILNVSNTVSALNDPFGLALDNDGNLYFSEAGGHRVIRFQLATRQSTLLAGTGTAGDRGDGAAAIDARLNSPGDLALDAAGNLYIADRGNGRLRRINPAGRIDTVAGSSRGFSYIDLTGQLATAIGLGRLDGLAVSPNNEVFFAESSRITKLQPDGRLEVVAGYLGEDDKAVASYRLEALNGVEGLAFAPNGDLYFSRSQQSRVSRLVFAPRLAAPVIRPNGVVSSSGFGAAPASASNGWIEIYGENFATAAQTWAGADFSGGQPPSNLNGLQVTVAGLPAYLSFVSPNQINALLPEALPTGLLTLLVSHSGGQSAPYPFPINNTQPGLLAPPAFLIDGRAYAAALLPGGTSFALPADSLPGVSSRPARPGEIITLFGIGFADSASGFTISIGGRSASVLYAGPAPGQFGLYQFNVQVPSVTTDPASPLSAALDNQPLTQALHIAVAP